MRFTTFIAAAAMLSQILVAPAYAFAATTPKTPAKKTVVAPKKTTPAPKAPAIPATRATLLISSAHELRVAPGESVQVRLGYKNTGTTTWKSTQLRAVGADTAKFADASWVSTSTMATSSEATVKVGRLEIFTFTVQAPQDEGSYVIHAALTSEGTPVYASDVSIPVVVEKAESSQTVSDTANLQPEPRIRVALGKAEGSVTLQSVGDYQLLGLDGALVSVIPSGSTFVWAYNQNSKEYSITFGGSITTSTLGFRFTPLTPDGRFVWVDHQDHPSWNKSINYNQYRDTFEFRWSDKIPGLWMINELPFESYLKGLIEVGNSEAPELQKAVYSAARSYAYVNLPNGVQYVNRMWDVHAVWDQYYKGYAAEASNPTGVASVDATHGLVITYQGHPVITPYFTQSNGSTIGWKQAWGGTDKPWLQPVAATYDAGKKMLGHGVGMSTHDAKAHAEKDGWTFDQILHYYYTGIELTQVYK